MAFDGLDISEITEAHITALIGTLESRDLDFKQQEYGRADQDKKEFAADVSAFANTIGGHLLIGVAEENGAASTTPGITGDIDTEIQRLESIALTGIQPRIIGLQMRAVPMAAGNSVLVIRIPKSWNSPHRVTLQGVNRFYLRAGSRRYEPDVDELRQLFEGGRTLSQRIRDFHNERIAKIVGHDTPVPTDNSSALVMHVIPYAAFLGGTMLDTPTLSGAANRFYPMAATGMNRRVNLEGIVTYTGTAAPHPAYTQVWRNGCIEAVRGLLVVEGRTNGVKAVVLNELTRKLLGGIDQYLKGLAHLGFQPPFAVLVTLIGAKGAILHVGNTYFDEQEQFDRDILTPSEIIIDKIPTTDAEMQDILDPILHQIANAAGYDAAPGI
ncbi:MAG: ATP-binding protein [Alphaproteobacteria bacterium]|nr:ATP-binding protein [Alphaproteobacteria bacterium]